MRPFDGEAFLTSQMKDKPGLLQIPFKGESFFLRSCQGPLLHDFRRDLLFIRDQPLGNGCRKII